MLTGAISFERVIVRPDRDKSRPAAAVQANAHAGEIQPADSEDSAKREDRERFRDFPEHLRSIAPVLSSVRCASV